MKRVAVLLLVTLVALAVAGCWDSEAKRQVAEKDKIIAERDATITGLRKDLETARAAVASKEEDVKATNQAVQVAVQERDACLAKVEQAGSQGQAAAQELSATKAELDEMKKKYDFMLEDRNTYKKKYEDLASTKAQ